MMRTSSFRSGFTALAVFLTFNTVSSLAFSARDTSGSFPRGPDLEMTPGSLCQRGSTFRYPEHVRYCNRDVDSKLKNEVIAEYDRELGFSVRSMPRGQFKIDHFIPLCAGGSNDRDNLWPQHKSVFTLTDPLEPLVCQKMADGRLKQADAVELIREAKTNLSRVQEIYDHVDSL